MKRLTKKEMIRTVTGGDSGGIAISWTSGGDVFVVTGSWNNDDWMSLNDSDHVIPKVKGLAYSLMRIYPPD